MLLAVLRQRTILLCVFWEIEKKTKQIEKNPLIYSNKSKCSLSPPPLTHTHKRSHLHGCDFHPPPSRELSHARWSIVTPMGAKGEAEKQAWSHLPLGLRGAPPTSTFSCHIHPHTDTVWHLQQMHWSTVRSWYTGRNTGRDWMAH